MIQKLKRILTAYRQLLGEIYQEAPVMVVLSVLASLAAGAASPLLIAVNSSIFDDGLLVAQGQMAFADYWPLLAALVLLLLLPAMIKDIFIYGYVEPRSQLILRTALKGKMLQKIKRMKYEHFESEASMEIIDKAYNRTENSARHLYPMYFFVFFSSLADSAGVLWILLRAKWWLLLTVLIPFALETYFSFKHFDNIYTEMEGYWKRERSYTTLGDFLKKKEYLKENKLHGASDFLVDTYERRMNERNREYEGYYFRHLRRQITKDNITKIAKIVNVLLLLLLFMWNEISVGLFISLSLTMFTGVFNVLSSTIFPLKWSGFHINTFDYYNKYFELSDDEESDNGEAPERVSLEFRDVWFRYPGTGRDILKGLSFTVKEGEKVSVVGENGEGKSTMIKLLLGLFTPDKGEILLNGQPLFSYSAEARSRIFGTVFQDFIRYSVSARENVVIGGIQGASPEAYAEAVRKAKAESFIEKLPDGPETLLGRDFEDGVDLSGGQWQRIAIARAFMGDKPVLIMDEPTSQLDPIAESQLYTEFADMAANKTAIFITHRLASTMITDRILVISGGCVTENGTHGQLMALGGQYAEMFEAQKHWYQQEGEA